MEQSEAIIAYAEKAFPARCEPKGKNYIVNAVTQSKLIRDVDFGVIPKTKKPTLFKSGAEKVAFAYGLMQRYEIVNRISSGGDAPFFYYEVKCSLIHIEDGKEYPFTEGYGCANTGESRNGFAGAYNSANTALKMAQKRALVQAALAISGLSDMFTQDMENEDFINKAKDLVNTENPESAVTTQQIRRLYAIGAERGLTADEVKNKLAAKGYTSTKLIKQKDYNSVCELLEADA